MKEYLLKQADESTEETKARSAFRVGMTLYGYCQGRFGRDSYGNKEILEVHADSLTVRDEDGVVSTSFTIDSWVGLLESSNHELEYRTRNDK